jgi:hypothetical protein
VVAGVCGFSLGVSCGFSFVVSGFGVAGSWALSTQKLPIANEKLSIVNNNIFLTIVLSSHARLRNYFAVAQ